MCVPLNNVATNVSSGLSSGAHEWTYLLDVSAPAKLPLDQILHHRKLLGSKQHRRRRNPLRHNRFFLIGNLLQPLLDDKSLQVMVQNCALNVGLFLEAWPVQRLEQVGWSCVPKWAWRPYNMNLNVRKSSHRMSKTTWNRNQALSNRMFPLSRS